MQIDKKCLFLKYNTLRNSCSIIVLVYLQIDQFVGGLIILSSYIRQVQPVYCDCINVLAG